MLKNFLFRGWNWCKRFRHRCGYGVHSPADFYLITFVAYESLPYYAYSKLHALRKKVHGLPQYREKVDKFLFRLVNHLHPEMIWDFGTGSGVETCYMAHARQVPVCTWALEALPPGVVSLLDEMAHVHRYTGGLDKAVRQWTESVGRPSLVHIGHTSYYKEVFEAVLPYMQPSSCIIVGTPYADKEKQQWWNQVIADPRTGVTFDFYDIGLVFFDFKRVKEHRIVNFL